MSEVDARGPVTGRSSALRTVWSRDVGNRRIAVWREQSSHERIALGLLGVVIVLGGWQLLANLGVLNPIIYSSPAEIASTGWTLTETGILWPAIVSSAQLFAVGFAIALVSGVALGLILGWYQRISALLEPWVSIFYATPSLAFIPIIVLLAGVSMQGRLLVVWLIAVFPIIINTASGVRAMDRQHFNVARSFMATNRFVLLRVAVPGASPSIIAGIHNGMMLSLVGVVVSEFLIGGTGVGGMIYFAGQELKTADAFVGSLIFAGAALILSAGIRALERRLCPWRF